MKITSLFFLAGFLFCTSNAIAQKFNITGKAEDINDHTWLYLSNGSNVKLDSCQVENNSFSFKGSMTEPTQQAILHDAKFSNYVIFWLEPKTIQITLKNNEFKKAIIKGSTSQDQNAILNKLTAPFEKKIDSLNSLLRTAKTSREELMQAYKEAKKQEQEAYQDYVKNNSNSLIATYVLNVYARSWGKEKATNLYQGLSDEMKNTKTGKDIYTYISVNQNIAIGKKYIDFEQTNANDQPIKLSNIKGKYILLEFWASWCGPCRGENPNLVKTYLTYKPKGFEILGVSADNNKDAWLKAIKDDQLPWENVSDLKGDQNLATLIYGIYSFPTNYLIDQNGIIIAKDLRGDELKRKLAELMP